MPELWALRQYQALPLLGKISLSYSRIKEWYDYFNGNVYISFSGGKDSTVLADLVHTIKPDVPLVFSNTGLEFPEIQSFAKKMGAEFVYPKMRFDQVISTYGYPLISKENAEAIHYARRINNSEKTPQRKRSELLGTRDDGLYKDSRRNSLLGIGPFKKEKGSIFNKEKWLPAARDTTFKISHRCCDIMKKSPLKIWQHANKKYPFIGNLASESRIREQAWVRKGCNAFDGSKASSQPMAFWHDEDVLRYIVDHELEIASVYGDIVGTNEAGEVVKATPGDECTGLHCSNCQRTGCIFCGFGCHLDKGETRFQKLARTHPRQYEYCMGGGQYVDNPDYDPTIPKMDGEWQNWNPKQIWVPSKKGLGMKKVFDEMNSLYGNNFIRYE